MYYKLRCNSTQFVIYYKLRNYYKLQRNTAHLCAVTYMTEAKQKYRGTFNTYKHHAERLTVHANVIFPTFENWRKKNPAYFWFIKRQNYIQNIIFS